MNIISEVFLNQLLLAFFVIYVIILFFLENLSILGIIVGIVLILIGLVIYLQVERNRSLCFTYTFSFIIISLLNSVVILTIVENSLVTFFQNDFKIFVIPWSLVNIGYYITCRSIEEENVLRQRIRWLAYQRTEFNPLIDLSKIILILLIFITLNITYSFIPSYEDLPRYLPPLIIAISMGGALLLFPRIRQLLQNRNNLIWAVFVFYQFVYLILFTLFFRLDIHVIFSKVILIAFIFSVFFTIGFILSILR